MSGIPVPPAVLDATSGCPCTVWPDARAHSSGLGFVGVISRADAREVFRGFVSDSYLLLQIREKPVTQRPRSREWEEADRHRNGAAHRGPLRSRRSWVNGGHTGTEAASFSSIG